MKILGFKKALKNNVKLSTPAPKTKLNFSKTYQKLTRVNMRGIKFLHIQYNVFMRLFTSVIK